jgi:hypothetical protein
MPRARRNKAHDRKLARRIRDEGVPVFIHGWNSGGPGIGAGAEYIYELDDRMAVTSSEDDEVHGPYDDLASLFTAHPNLLTVTTATESLECAYLDADALATMLSFWSPPPDPDFERLLPMLSSIAAPKTTVAFTINGDPWTFTKEQGFHRVAQESRHPPRTSTDARWPNL